ncbi:hypothetical protein V5O48_003599 [Marasmius crinis-equi]|uniref:Uncharacterized protein n=1 Tax=Marasmius crinis-equi TaxID=585013 RepID=A0ABR3FSE6_9AGAR
MVPIYTQAPWATSRFDLGLAGSKVWLDGPVSDDTILPYELKGSLSRSRSKRQRRQEYKTIYLFVRSLPASVFWSFEEDGRIPIPDDLRKYLGLPTKLLPEFKTFPFQTKAYKAMRDYQILRGFDPTTADFARHCGFYDLVFEPVEPSLTTTPSRLAEPDVAAVDPEHETTEDLYKSLPALFGDVPAEDDAPEPAETLARRALNANIWSLFSQAAWKVSDILAMGF